MKNLILKAILTSILLTAFYGIYKALDYFLDYEQIFAVLVFTSLSIAAKLFYNVSNGVGARNSINR